jgi:hypothetical protein
MPQITDIRATEILDSRGHPTVAASVVLDAGASGHAAAPSGAFTGSREAVELRDKDPKRYGGKGVTLAVGHVNGELRSALRGRDPQDQRGIDSLMIELDGKSTKSRLGANAILAVSLAVARAAVKSHSWRSASEHPNCWIPVMQQCLRRGIDAELFEIGCAVRARPKDGLHIGPALCAVAGLRSPAPRDTTRRQALARLAIGRLTRGGVIPFKECASRAARPHVPPRRSRRFASPVVATSSRRHADQRAPPARDDHSEASTPARRSLERLPTARRPAAALDSRRLPRQHAFPSRLRRSCHSKDR